MDLNEIHQHMELNKAASALTSGLVTAWQSASHFTYDKYCLNMLAKMLSSLKLKDYISRRKQESILHHQLVG